MGGEPPHNGVGGEHSHPPIGDVVLEPGMLHPRNFYKVGTNGTSRMGKQLVMEILAELPNGEQKKLMILIDTGAEINLVRSGLLSSHLFFVAEKPMRLMTASGQVLPGGDKTVQLELFFSQMLNGELLDDFFHAELNFTKRTLRSTPFCPIHGW